MSALLTAILLIVVALGVLVLRIAWRLFEAEDHQRTANPDPTKERG